MIEKCGRAFAKRWSRVLLAPRASDKPTYISIPDDWLINWALSFVTARKQRHSVNQLKVFCEHIVSCFFWWTEGFVSCRSFPVTCMFQTVWRDLGTIKTSRESLLCAGVRCTHPHDRWNFPQWIFRRTRPASRCLCEGKESRENSFSQLAIGRKSFHFRFSSRSNRKFSKSLRKSNKYVADLVKIGRPEAKVSQSGRESWPKVPDSRVVGDGSVLGRLYFEKIRRKNFFFVEFSTKAEEKLSRKFSTPWKATCVAVNLSGAFDEKRKIRATRAVA